MSIIETSLQTLQSSVPDSDKFAALFTITKAMQNNSMEQLPLVDIFQAVSAPFLKRLLTTEIVPDGCSKYVYKSLAMSMIGKFCTCETLLGDPGLLQLISEINKLLNLPKLTPCEHEDEVHQIVTDCYDCLEVFVESTTARHELVRQHTVTALCNCLAANILCSKRAGELLLRLAAYLGREVYVGNLEGLYTLLEHLCKMFASHKKDEEKYNYCSQLFAHLSSVTKDQLHELKNLNWSRILQGALYLQMQRKLDQVKREQTLKLAILLIELLGIPWILTDSSDQRFLPLVLHLCCIEIRVVFEQKDGLDIANAENSGDLLVHCFSFVEMVIMYLSNVQQIPLESRQIDQLQAAMRGAFSAILMFLKGVQTTHRDKKTCPIVLATVRVLSAYLAEETAMLRQETIEILPILIDIGEESFKQSIDEASGREPSEEVLRFLLPGLCHLTAEDAPRKKLIQNRLIEVLAMYFRHYFNEIVQCIRQRNKTLVGEPSVEWANPAYIMEAKNALSLTCGIILNVTVMEQELLLNNPSFTDFLSTIYIQLPTMVREEHFVIAAYNLMVIGLMSLRTRSIFEFVPQDEAHVFFGAILELLFCHDPDGSPAKDSCLKVRPAYTAANWHDLHDLWFLGMQAFASVITKTPECLDQLEQTHLLHTSVAALLQIDQHIEDSTMMAYRAVLTEMAKVPAKRPFLVSANVMKVAQLYSMEHLISLLVTRTVDRSFRK